MNKSGNISSKIFRLETLVVLYFTALLLLGPAFTKFKVVGPLYLHDLCLGTLTLLALNNRRKIILRDIPVVILILLGFIYLLYSVVVLQPKGHILLMTFRQFNFIIYLLCAYLIFNTLVSTPQEVTKPIRLLKFIAYSSVLLQIIFMIYGFIFIPGFGLFGKSDYNYFSPLVLFGVITFGGYILAYEAVAWKRYLKFFFCILLSTTLGHSSAFLALFVVLLIYFFIRITPLQRLIAICLALLAITSLFLLPQFTDFNAGWRLLYWKHVIQRLVVENLMVFGFGFGQPYMTHGYAVYMNNLIHSYVMLDSYDPLARYVNPPHNSLLTLAFHIGLLPSLLLFVSLKNYFSLLFFRKISTDANTNFLLYILSGSIVWIFFNVVLELPHTSTYFWLIYLTTLLYLNKYSPVKRSTALQER